MSNGDVGTQALTWRLPKSRAERLYNELRYAVSRTDSETLSRWALQSLKLFGAAVVRRLKGLGALVKKLLEMLVREATETHRAVRAGNLRHHAARKGQELLEKLQRTGGEVSESAKALVQRIADNPREAAPQLLAGVLGFYLGSGGLDANGGIPDTDIAVGGIGSHRSVFTHSILTGAALEAGIFSLVLLANVVHANLPEQHDEFWDRLVAETNRLAVAFAAGACAGLAYHLLADSSWQAGKAYTDLPFTMPMEGHQLVMGASAVAEAVRAEQIASAPARASVRKRS